MTTTPVPVPRQPSWRLGFYALSVALVEIVVACGGGSNSPDTGVGGTPTECTKTFTDSFGNSVTCATMRNLPGAEFASGDGGSGDAGADGAAADGAPIANAVIRITDVNGRQITTITDANGYYRVNIGGLTQPLIAAIERNGNAWRTGMVDVIQKGRTNFYTLNLTGLTDLVLADLAASSGVIGGADAIKPSVLAANANRLGTSVSNVNNIISARLQEAGLNVSSFDPLKNPFRTDKTGYDQVLDNVTIVKSRSETKIDPSSNYSLSGSWSMTAVIEGVEIDVGLIDGAAVPPSSMLAGIDFTTGLGQTEEAYSYVENGKTYTLTVLGNSSVLTGPQTNFTVTIDDISISNYIGCGVCGISSAVSYTFSMIVSSGGTMDGEAVPYSSSSSSVQIVYRRVS